MRPKLVKGGRALLMKALRLIDKYPETFDMCTFYRRDPDMKGKDPYCGTTACLAGHILLAAGRRHISEGRPSTDAATLVVGKGWDNQWAMIKALFYGDQCTPAQIRRRVVRWLETGK